MNGKAIFCSIYGKQYGEVKKKLILIKAQLCQETPAVKTYGDGTLREWGDFWLEAMARPPHKAEYLGRIWEDTEKSYLSWSGRREADGAIQRKDTGAGKPSSEYDGSFHAPGCMPSSENAPPGRCRGKADRSESILGDPDAESQENAAPCSYKKGADPPGKENR